MLFLLQNEIGEIVGRTLTRSENNSETERLLRDAILPRVSKRDADVDPLIVVTDNAGALRKVVESVFGSIASVRQDPFHVIQRFNEKLKNKSKRKVLASQLSAAIYTVDQQLRAPPEMEAELRSCTKYVPAKDLSCSQTEWIGCTESNMKQVARGDLCERVNTRVEGNVEYTAVSTSQLESFHSTLKKFIGRNVSLEVGLSMLDIHIM